MGRLVKIIAYDELGWCKTHENTLSNILGNTPVSWFASLPQNVFIGMTSYHLKSLWWCKLYQTLACWMPYNVTWWSFHMDTYSKLMAVYTGIHQCDIGTIIHSRDLENGFQPFNYLLPKSTDDIDNKISTITITIIMLVAICDHPNFDYRQVSHISRTLVGIIIVDTSDVVGASPVGAAPNTSSLST